MDRKKPSIALLILLLVAAGLVSLTLGRYAIAWRDLPGILVHGILPSGSAANDPAATVVFAVRIPRILAALLVGAALSVSGATYQGLFRNPMVSPDILGASAGAGFGASLAILLSLNAWGIQLWAFMFGLIAVLATYGISTAISKGTNSILILVLTGVLMATLFASFTSIIKFVADPNNKLPAITFWLMGGLANVNRHDVLILLITLVLGGGPLVLLRWKLNVMSFGDEEAQSMGINTGKIRLVVIVCSTLLTAAAVAISGVIGFVGLVIPHMTRLLVGPNYRALLPASFLTGGIFLLVVDDVARCAFPAEIPLGILTSLVGAPFFLYLLMKGRQGWI